MRSSSTLESFVCNFCGCEEQNDVAPYLDTAISHRCRTRLKICNQTISFGEGSMSAKKLQRHTTSVVFLNILQLANNFWGMSNFTFFTIGMNYSDHDYSFQLALPSNQPSHNAHLMKSKANVTAKLQHP